MFAGPRVYTFLITMVAKIKKTRLFGDITIAIIITKVLWSM